MSKLDTITKRPVIALKRPTFRSAYSEPKRVSITTADARTEQSHKDECDINQILAKYIKGEFLEHQMTQQSNYGDFTSFDFHEAQNIIAKANSMFEELPSNIRNKFQNDPAQFLDFTADENNHAEMVELGLANPTETPVNTEPVATPSNNEVTPGEDTKAD